MIDFLLDREVANMGIDPFKEYLRESEPDKAYKGYAWSTAIGLQAEKLLCTAVLPN